MHIKTGLLLASSKDLNAIAKTIMLKIIENNHYHIWADALHARALSHQVRDK